MPSRLNDQRILVTGGCGFIGSALVRLLIRSTAATVVNVDKLTYAGNPDSLLEVKDDPRHHFECVDICDPVALRDVFARHDPTSVVHLAAESHVDRSIDGPADFINTNVLGSFALLEAARRHYLTLPAHAREAFRFVHVSTDEVYGSVAFPARFTEDSPYRPSSPYSASKAASDHLARAWFRTYELPVIVTNCSNNYGPFQFPEKLIPLVIGNAIAGRTLPVYGRGENVRDWLFVDDHARGLLLALQRGAPGSTYVFGGAGERRNIDVVREVCRLVDELVPDDSMGPRESLIQLVEDRPGHDLRYAVDATAARRDLAWSPEVSFESGLRRTVRWYLENEWWSARIRAGTYQGERLGLAVGR